jgi:hypothetical protein
MSKLHLQLKKKWFEMTKAGIKTEDYREITPYWCNRLLLFNGKIESKERWQKCFFKIDYKSTPPNYLIEDHIDMGIVSFQSFETNMIFLGYPKSIWVERILQYEHKGIEISKGKSDWGADPEKFYFVIKHGSKI